ncbi:MAG: M24 family metallopeptidase [Thaumarchaeota archaeon]|nr:M24 family metallopeptidase [Nitrososphaerota archaeon]
MTVYAERRKKLLALARGKQVVAMTAPNLFYLTDFFGSGVAIVRPDKTVVVTSPLGAARAGEVGKEVEVVVAKRPKDILNVLMRRLEEGIAVVDNDGEVRRYKRFKMRPDLFLEARRIKDETEVDRIRKASKGLDKIFEALPSELKPGRTEWEVAAEVMKLATTQGLTPSGSDSALSPTIIASGENGALPHSELTGRKLRMGDFVVADIFFRYEGYNSDETRTFCLGTPTSAMKKHYAAVLEAQLRALDVAKPGVACEQVHKAAVRVLAKHGVAKYLNHSVGHGVGIDIHELPGISNGNKSKLLVNDVITDEPGIYLRGKYGIRIEDTLKIDRKPVLLTKYTKELVTCG